MSEYKIELTKNQISCIARGLEFYSRFLAGQWRIPDEMEFQEYNNQDKRENFWNDRNYIEDQLGKMSSLFTKMHQNASYGIGSNKLAEDAKLAYDIYRPILEELIGKGENWNVYSSPGLPYSQEGRIKVTKDG